MKNIIIAMNIFFLLISLGISKDYWWSQSYEMQNHPEKLNLFENNENTLILTQRSYHTNGIYNMQVQNIDKQGNVIWNQTDTNAEYFFESQKNAYYFAGSTSNGSVGYIDLAIQKLDKDGNSLWKKIYDGDNRKENSPFLVDNTDGSLFVAAHTLGDIWLQKLDENGGIIWAKTYGGEEPEYFPQLYINTDGTLFLAAITNSFGKGHSDIWLQKIDEDGNVLWSKTYGGEDREDLLLLKVNNDGTFFLEGKTRSFGSAPGWNRWLQKIDQNGNVLWSRITPQQYEHMYIISNDDSTLYELTVYQEDLLLEKLDINGNTMWKRTYNSGEIDDSPHLIESNDGTLLLISEIKGREDNRIKNKGLWIQKITTDGKTLWSEILGSKTEMYHPKLLETKDSTQFVIGISRSEKNIHITSLPPVQYCSKQSPLSFKVSPDNKDSFSYEYSLLDAPENMHISPSGTITWIPTSDSAFMEHITFIKTNSNSDTDTLWFDVWANHENLIDITTLEKDSTATATVQGTVVTTELIGGVYQKDTVITTTINDTIHDSLFTVTETYTKGVLTSSKAVFISSTSTVDEISSTSVTKKYDHSNDVVIHKDSNAISVVREIKETTDLIGEIGREDTIFTTIVYDTISDSIFSVTETYFKGNILINSVAIFIAETITVNEVFSSSVLKKYKDPVALTNKVVIIEPVNLSINPVRHEDCGVTIFLPKGNGKYKMKIFDVVGNVLFSRSGSLDEKAINWNLVNRCGFKVSSGSFLVMIEIKESNGFVKVQRSLLGVQR